MPVSSAEKRVVVESTPAALAARVADRFLTRVRARTRNGRVAHIALTGGSMGGAVLRATADDPRSAAIDWSLVHFWWGDERFVPRDDADRNSLQSREALLDHIPVPAENVHEVAGPETGLTLDESAAAYAAELARFGTDEHPWPSFAVCFLGVGPDGHIASLFPDREEVTVTDAAALAVRDSPKPRLSASRSPVRCSTRRSGCGSCSPAPTRPRHSDSPSPVRATRACRRPAPRGASAPCSSWMRPPPPRSHPTYIDQGVLTVASLTVLAPAATAARWDRSAAVEGRRHPGSRSSPDVHVPVASTAVVREEEASADAPCPVRRAPALDSQLLAVAEAPAGGNGRGPTTPHTAMAPAIAKINMTHGGAAAASPSTTMPIRTATSGSTTVRPASPGRAVPSCTRSARSSRRPQPRRGARGRRSR